jgi:membrane glycosyltransferase
MYAKGFDAQIVESDSTMADLPQESPLAMPCQDFFSKEAPKAPRHDYGVEPATILLRRSVLIGAAIVMTIMATVTLGASLPVHSAIIVKAAFLGVFTLLFGWLSFAFMTCLAGVWRMLVDHEDERLGLTDHTPLEDLNTMTALLAPVYNENPDDVTRRLLAMDSALAQRGAARNFHIFILSDSNNPDVIDREYAAFQELRARAFHGAERIFYRRRTENLERKSGNIADWVRRFGGAYDNMITLDADSVMSAETMVRLAAAMERHQEVGLIQTTPRLVGRRSLFGRIEQFSHSLYGPLLTQGMAWWSGAEANYYGHNAIIRTRAFAENAGLPVLPGRRPFGGAVLSHDFVEAALIRRGGWAVLHAPSLGGSYEECPPTLDDYLDRDRRWCQGNVQHISVLGARGLHWVNRIHLAFGAAAYFTAPLWLAFIALSLVVRSAEPLDMRSIYDFNPHEGTHDIGAGLVYFGCMTLLFAPKFIAFLSGDARRAPEEELRRTGRDFVRHYGAEHLLRNAGAGLHVDADTIRVRHPDRPRFRLEVAVARRTRHAHERRRQALSHARRAGCGVVLRVPGCNAARSQRRQYVHHRLHGAGLDRPGPSRASGRLHRPRRHRRRAAPRGHSLHAGGKQSAPRAGDGRAGPLCRHDWRGT